MRVLLETLGCRLNLAEIDNMAGNFAQAGHRVVSQGEPADIIVFNSCAVTHNATRKSRQILRRLRRANPQAAIVATGCYAQLSPHEVEALGADLVLGNDSKDSLPYLLSEAGLLPGSDAFEEEALFSILPDLRRRTRAFVKVQDGCDQRCTFCIVTVARGAARRKVHPRGRG